MRCRSPLREAVDRVVKHSKSSHLHQDCLVAVVRLKCGKSGVRREHEKLLCSPPTSVLSVVLAAMECASVALAMRDGGRLLPRHLDSHNDEALCVFIRVDPFASSTVLPVRVDATNRRLHLTSVALVCTTCHTHDRRRGLR